ncbi:hypothetical protein SLEP1_g45294 [Rubroshorea leprosula]|uniref:BRCT domain-containing protein n=1 Tax=Rubroshorea leprosula TaxID=152421 RepID=A0AAV5LK36_9ROSI|nr:hypothetical protein SLEP1_g45294 [Rubroshorea leprosula]
MPKHYRPPGKKKEGDAARYVTRSQAVKSLQVSLPLFRKLCILKGIFPREPKKKVKGNHHTNNHTKRIAFIQHDPMLEKFREIRAYQKKIKKAKAKKNEELARALKSLEPHVKMDKFIRDRYPTFIDAIRDLDDALSMVHLFAALPASDRLKIGAESTHNCRRLCHAWQAYISHTHKLRKVFISAEVEGQKILWLTPHTLQQVLTEDVDFDTLLGFVNFTIYHSINLKYLPILDPRLEALAADLYALSRYIDAGSGASLPEPQTASSSKSEQEAQEESELRLAQLQHQLPTNEPGALMHLVQDTTSKVEEDEDTRECKILFQNMKFFLSREVLREEYIQPQWVYDCVNARIILPTEPYMVERVPPPHLSPFVDDEAEGYVPDYAKTIKQLQAASRNDVLPLPGMGKDELDDPQHLLAEGYINRTEANEAAEKKYKIMLYEKQYQNELKMEIQGDLSINQQSSKEMDSKEESLPDMEQIANDADAHSKAMMSRRERGLYEAIRIGKKRKETHVEKLKERKRNIQEAQKPEKKQKSA